MTWQYKWIVIVCRSIYFTHQLTIFSFSCDTQRFLHYFLL